MKINILAIYLISSALGVTDAYAQSQRSWEREYERRKSLAYDGLVSFSNSICEVAGSQSLENVREEISVELESLEDARINAGLTRITDQQRSEFEGVPADRLEGWSRDPVQCRQEIVAQWRDDLLLPDLVLVRVDPDGTFINNRNFGPIDGSISSLTLSVDGREVIDVYLDEPFRGNFKIDPGTHEFLFEADVMGFGDSLNMLDGRCDGIVDLFEDGQTLIPDVTFEMIGFDGVFSECSLN